MPSSPAPQLRFICESPSDASNHPHGSSAKPAYLIKADALRNYWEARGPGKDEGQERRGPKMTIDNRLSSCYSFTKVSRPPYS